MELSGRLNTTLDYLLGKSDTNYLDFTKDDIQSLSKDELKALSDSLEKNVSSIFKIGKDKFNMNDQEMEAMKVIVLKQFLKEIEEKDNNGSPNL